MSLCSDETTDDPDLGQKPPFDIYFSSHPNIRLQSCGIKGKGLFAIAPIEEGEEIWVADPNTHPTGKVLQFEAQALFSFTFNLNLGLETS